MIRSILLAHARRYPQMEPTDAVKLLYQSEFGGGHLIRDEKACLDRLTEEYRATPQSRDIPLTEDIGNGIVRVNLAALDANGVTPEQLGRVFLHSSAQVRGTEAAFREKLPAARAFHMSGKTDIESGMRFRREGVPMGLPGLDEWHIQQTDPDVVKAARAALDA